LPELKIHILIQLLIVKRTSGTSEKGLSFSLAVALVILYTFVYDSIKSNIMSKTLDLYYIMLKSDKNKPPNVYFHWFVNI